MPAKGLAEGKCVCVCVGGGGGGCVFYILKKNKKLFFHFPCISIAKNGQFYPNLGFEHISSEKKNVFITVMIGKYAIYLNFIFHHFVDKFTLLLSLPD